MTINDALFWAASAVAIASTALVLMSRNPFYAVLYLILSLFGVSMIFFTLGAQFLAVLEIIVYAGAIMVLFLFVVQMLSPGIGAPVDDDLKSPTWKQLVIPGFLASILFGITLMALLKGGNPATSVDGIVFDAKTLGIALFNHHYLGVELASLVLLIGIVGGMHLGRAGTRDDEPEVTDAIR